MTLRTSGDFLVGDAGHLDHHAVRAFRLKGEIFFTAGAQALLQNVDGLLHIRAGDRLFGAVLIVAGLKLHDELAAASKVDAKLEAHRFRRVDGGEGGQRDEERAHPALGLVHGGADVNQEHHQDGCSDKEGDERIHGQVGWRLGLKNDE
jgi:hypothetical protein